MVVVAVVVVVDSGVFSISLPSCLMLLPNENYLVITILQMVHLVLMK